MQSQKRKRYTKDTTTSTDDIVTLIRSIRQNPALYNYKLQPNQRRRIDVLSGWAQIAAQIGNKYTVEECRRKWKNLRDTYHQYRLRKPKLGDSGLSKWRYAKELEFLSTVYQPKLKSHRLPSHNHHHHHHPIGGGSSSTDQQQNYESDLIQSVVVLNEATTHDDDEEHDHDDHIEMDDGCGGTDEDVGGGGGVVIDDKSSLQVHHHSNITLVNNDDAETFILTTYEDEDEVGEQDHHHHHHHHHMTLHDTHDSSTTSIVDDDEDENAVHHLVKNDNSLERNNSLDDEGCAGVDVDYEEVCLYEEAGGGGGGGGASVVNAVDCETIIGGGGRSGASEDSKSFQYIDSSDFCIGAMGGEHHQLQPPSSVSSGSSAKLKLSHVVVSGGVASVVTSLAQTAPNVGDMVQLASSPPPPPPAISFKQEAAAAVAAAQTQTREELDLFFDFLKKKMSRFTQEEITVIQVEFLNCVLRREAEHALKHN